MTEVMIKKLQRIKRKELLKIQMQQVILKIVVREEKVLYLKCHQHQVNRAEHRIMMMERRRKLKLQAKRSDVHKPIKPKLKFE